MIPTQTVGRFHCRICWSKTIHNVVAGHEQEMDAPIECERCGNVIDRVNRLDFSDGQARYVKYHPITVEMRRAAIDAFIKERESIIYRSSIAVDALYTGNRGQPSR